MLPTDLLEFGRTPDGQLLPRWLSARDEPWLRELLAESGACAGMDAEAAGARVVDVVARSASRHGVSRRVVAAAWSIERRRWKTRVEAPVPPITLRRVVFELAAERSREESILTAAAELEMEASCVESSLYADRPKHRKMVAPPEECLPGELIEQYNLSLVQSLLVRAVDATALVRAHVRRVVRAAKLQRLMCSFEDHDESATKMSVTGPLSIFHDTVKYGRALARWFPALVTTKGWELSARIFYRGQPFRVQLDASCPIARTQEMSPAFDSRLEARLDRDLRRLHSPWLIEREVAVVRLLPKLWFPDFALVSARGRVLIEVVGYWTESYLASKLACLRAATEPLILCMEQGRAPTELSSDPRVFCFHKHIDAAALLERCEQLLTKGRST